MVATVYVSAPPFEVYLLSESRYLRLTSNRAYRVFSTLALYVLPIGVLFLLAGTMYREASLNYYLGGDEDDVDGD